MNIVPNEKISIALAKVLDIDEEELILEGYLDKAPIFLNKYINKFICNIALISTGIFDNIEDDFDLDGINIEELIRNDFKIVSKANVLLQVMKMKDTKIIKENKKTMKIKDNSSIMIMNDVININVEDDGMAPIIPKNSKVNLVIQGKYKNGDVVCVKTKKGFIVRAIINIGNSIFLYPYNQEYECIMPKENEYTIMGKVSRYSIEL